jgi:hypothetical protein
MEKVRGGNEESELSHPQREAGKHASVRHIRSVRPSKSKTTLTLTTFDIPLYASHIALKNPQI